MSVFTVFRQGDIGTSWYAVLSGSLDVKVSETANHQVKPGIILTPESRTENVDFTVTAFVTELILHNSVQL